MNGLDVFPPQASVVAKQTDAIFFWLVVLSVAIVVLVGGLVTVFSIRYRQGSKAKRGDLPNVLSRDVEIGWTAATLFLALFVFWWAASSQLTGLTPPKNAMEIHVVAKQWMWKVQHPSGVREIDALHAPSGTPVKLVMTSQDAIHAFYVPAFRMKQDVLPGRYTQTWFTATRTGTYPLYCTEFCGTDHAKMLGEVVVMKPDDYGRWVSAQPQPGNLVGQGLQLYDQLGCGNCHQAKPNGAGSAAGAAAPTLAGLYGSQVALSDGRVVTADESYLRDALVQPDRQPVAGFPPLMPSYAKATDEQGLIALIAYLKALPRPRGEAGTAPR